MSDSPQFPLLWFTSGTPQNVGQHSCAYERWLGYSAGAHGTGYRSVQTAVPLATGAGVHSGLELIGKWILDWQHAHVAQRLTAVPDEVTAWAAAEAADAYARRARARGLEMTKTDSSAMDAVELTIGEQKTLIEAQVWIYALVRLPFMLSNRRLIDVEREEAPVIDCTCGLGDWVGEADVHAARACRGIVAMGKADFLWEVVEDSHDATRGTIEYEEFKTKATPNFGWENAWEHSGQLFRNMEAASRRLGRDVSKAYVPVLFKGKRDRWDREDKTQPKVQQSPLVYGYYDPGNGMGRDAEWQAKYRWTGEDGKGHTLPHSYKRRLISDESIDLPEENPNRVQFRADASRVERWVRGWITPTVEFLKVLGPFPKPHALVPDYIQAMLTEERRWRGDVEFLRSMGIYEPSDGHTLHAGEGILTAAHVISRSWACTRFDGTRCSFLPICRKDPGWEDVRSMGRYEIRTPHHSTEKADAEARGVVFAADDEEEDSDDN